MATATQIEKQRQEQEDKDLFTAIMTGLDEGNTPESIRKVAGFKGLDMELVDKHLAKAMSILEYPDDAIRAQNMEALDPVARATEIDRMGKEKTVKLGYAVAKDSLGRYTKLIEKFGSETGYDTLTRDYVFEPNQRPEIADMFASEDAKKQILDTGRVTSGQVAGAMEGERIAIGLAKKDMDAMGTLDKGLFDAFDMLMGDDPAVHLYNPASWGFEGKNNKRTTTAKTTQELVNKKMQALGYKDLSYYQGEQKEKMQRPMNKQEREALQFIIDREKQGLPTVNTRKNLRDAGWGEYIDELDAQKGVDKKELETPEGSKSFKMQDGRVVKPGDVITMKADGKRYRVNEDGTVSPL